MQVIKRDGTKQDFNLDKIKVAIEKALNATNSGVYQLDQMILQISAELNHENRDEIEIEEIQDLVENTLMSWGYFDTAKAYILYRAKHERTRDIVKKHIDFIEKYKSSGNTADATIDDNSNVKGKNVGILNAEIKKEENILVNRGIIMEELKKTFPDFDYKQYTRDLESKIIYKHDESSSNSGPTMPYCCSLSLYPFLIDGIKNLDGLSASPKNIDSFCGMYCNLIFSVAGQFLGAVATSEFLLYFTYFAKKEWGNDFYLHPDTVISQNCSRKKTIRSQIYQYWQQVIYTINQSAANRGMQAAFTNFSYFDKPFFEGMFGNFFFPDGTAPDWESLCWIQKEFMMWFNKERLRTMLTFPVESATLLYKDGEFVDKDMFEFICEEYERGHSFFTYISDSVDSLSSCCRLKNKLQTKEFNFTNGNIGLETGSKSVISLNLNRIVQNYSKTVKQFNIDDFLQNYLKPILERIYKYHIAYNNILHDMYDAGLLPVYKAGFINLDKQYLTIGLIGVTASAEYLGIKISDNEEYQNYCKKLFGFIKVQNELHRTQKENYNTECVPAEAAGVKLYNYDKRDGYWVPKDINLYTSYIFKPYDSSISVLDKFVLHGTNYIGDNLDGGAANHVNLDSHLSKEQYKQIIKFSAENGCQYFTFNIPNAECDDCGFIAKQPFKECPKCSSKNVSLWDRIIGYITKIKNWSEARRIEQKTRVYTKYDNNSNRDS